MIGVGAYAIVGLLVGGWLNVLADDLPGRHRPGKPRCTTCGASRSPRSWLSTLAYLLAQGRCSHCTAPVPLRGACVELGTATVFAYLFARFGLTDRMLLYSIYSTIFILVTVTDLEHRLILNVVIGPAIVLALVAGPFTYGLGWKSMLAGGVIGFLTFYILALLWPGGMGFGDVKLAAFIGLITGFQGVIVALIVTFLAGGTISLFLLVTRIRSLRDYIPYGPFLVIGGMVALLWGQSIVDAYMEPYQDDQPVEREESWFTLVGAGMETRLFGSKRAPWPAKDTRVQPLWTEADTKNRVSGLPLNLVQDLAEFFKGDGGECLGGGDPKAVGQQGHLGRCGRVGRFKDVQKVIGA